MASLPIDPMGIHNDSAALRLAENPCKTDNRYTTGINDISQHISSSNAGQLINISY